MKRFHFPLEQALNWRAQMARAEEARLEALFRKRRECEEVAARLESDKNTAERQVRAQSVLTAQDLESLESFGHYVVAQKARLARDVRQLNEAITAQQAKLTEARRQVRLLEKMKERKWDEWRAAADREMEAEAAELFLSKWSGRGGGA
jgi:flagellar export protein FliJ